MPRLGTRLERAHLNCTLGLLLACLLWVDGRLFAQALPPLPGDQTNLVLLTPSPGIVPQSPQFSEHPTPDEFFRVRVFEEPLVPLVVDPSPEENHALADALLAFAQRTRWDDYSSVLRFLAQHPISSWKPSLLTVLGLEFYHCGYFSRALSCWEDAWNLTKSLDDAKARRIADRALGELVKMQARIGRYEVLDDLLTEVKDRRLTGTATEWIAGAKQAVWTMHNNPAIAFRCGPFALRSILESTPSSMRDFSLIERSSSSRQGFSLAQVWDLSEKLHMNLQIATRAPGSEIIVPAVVHWKVGHFAAITRASDGRFQVLDPTFVDSFLMSRAALDNEASGVFLVPTGELPPGWAPMTALAASQIWGRGTTTGNDPNATTPYDLKGDSDCGSAGMATYNVHLLDVSLNVQDTPLSFSPPRGPRVAFTITYNQREANQPTIWTFSNLGNKWTHNWLSYIIDSGGTNSADVQRYVQGGGTETYTGFSATDSTFTIQWRSMTKLRRLSSTTYELGFPDGSRNIYGQPDGTVGASRKVFLTVAIDPIGYSNILSYDAGLRLAMITDPQLSRTNLTFSYSSGSSLGESTNTIRRVTDYCGRHADFAYDLFGLRIQSSTDPIGLTSAFAYTGEFMTSLTTAYGVTTFTFGEEGRMRWLETNDPEGGRTRTEFNESSDLGVPDSDPGPAVPWGMYVRNEILYGRNTFYWGKKAMHDAPGDYSIARIYHWLHSADMTAAVGVLESYKESLENRVWFNYPGQTSGDSATRPGTSSLPNVIGRVLDDGTKQFHQFYRNSTGNITNLIDPLGRKFTLTYDTNGIDLLSIRQARAGTSDLLASFTYNSQHLPTTYTNVAGQVTRYAYNAYGQLTALTNALSQVMTLFYDAVGHLTNISTPLPVGSANTYFSYDAYDRLRTLTSPDGVYITTDYDALDRPLTNSYADGSEVFTYDRLDLGTVLDRDLRFTRLSYNGNRQLTQVQHATNWITRFHWCSCGLLESFTDPNGSTVRFAYDSQGRMRSRNYINGTGIQYAYERTTSRLKATTNEQGVVKSWTYNLDDSISGISYSDGTPSVTFLYDSFFYWLAVVQDGGGGRTNLYGAITTPPTLNSGRLLVADGPIANDTIYLFHDALGRVTNRVVNGTPQALTYDVAGRLTNLVNALGNFSFAYDNPTATPTSLTFPNGQHATVLYNYPWNRNLSRYIFADRAGTNIFDHQFTTSPNGVVQAWSQISHSDPRLYLFCSPNELGELTHVELTTNVLYPSIQIYDYAYDLNGNRIFEKIDSITNVASVRSYYNSLNQLIGQEQPAGFSAKTLEWDGENRLKAITTGANRSEFTRDSSGRMVRLLEKVSGSIVTDRRFIWAGVEIVEERDGTGTNVVKRFFADGYQTGGSNYYYARDHLQSVRDIYDSNSVRMATITYDPFGRQTFSYLAAGFLKPDFGFAGHFEHFPSSLLLSLYRPYDPTLGRWLSRDPIGEGGGFNLYRYVFNDPVTYRDPLGLACEPVQGFILGEGQWRDREGRIRDSTGNLVRDQLNPLNVENFGPNNVAPKGPGTGIGPGTAHASEFITSNAARREAMRQAGIPTSQQPFSQINTSAGRQYIYDVNGQMWAVTLQTTDSVPGHGPHWEAGRVKPPGDYGLDPLGRQRVFNKGKVKVEYGAE